MQITVRNVAKNSKYGHCP